MQMKGTLCKKNMKNLFLKMLNFTYATLSPRAIVAMVATLTTAVGVTKGLNGRI